jgi:hypothetical protein
VDLEGDHVLDGEVVAAWFAGQWPFEIPIDHKGSVGPPDLSGFEYVFQNLELSKFPAYMPWVRMSSFYPAASFPHSRSHPSVHAPGWCDGHPDGVRIR